MVQCLFLKEIFKYLYISVYIKYADKIHQHRLALNIHLKFHQSRLLTQFLS
jgi:hypothetical protein